MVILLGFFLVFLPALQCTLLCCVLIIFYSIFMNSFPLCSMSSLWSSAAICLDDSFVHFIIMFCLCCSFFSGIMGLQHPGVLVHRATWAEPAVTGLDLWRAAQLLLDDRLLQPAGFPDSHETGTHGIRLPTCFPSAGDKTRWHTEGRAGTQPHSHTRASLQPHACTDTHTRTDKVAYKHVNAQFTFSNAFQNMGTVNTTEGHNLV